ncbi:MAG: hypothetical protein P1S60_10855, partial [Anaerolineae bacterium]|nr:hypothetical protein [Anaerolineae bacterium]
LYTHLSACRIRQPRSSAQLVAGQGGLTPASLMEILRDHGAGNQENTLWHPAPANPNMLCMHAGFGPTRNSQSVGSMVMHLDGDLDTAWVTGTSAPCTSLFKPVWLKAGLPDVGALPQGTYSTETLWWSHEKLHRSLLKDYPARSALLMKRKNAIESEFIQGISQLPDRRTRTLLDYSSSCFERATAFETEILPLIQGVPARDRLPILYRMAWGKFTREANFSLVS